MLDLASVQLDAPVSALAFSTAGDLAIASGRMLWLVPASGARPVRITTGTQADDGIECLAFHGARKLAIANVRSGVTILELGAPVRVMRVACEPGFHTLAWSPDGAYLAGGQYEPWVTVIDVAQCSTLRVLDPDEFDDEGRTAVQFLADGTLASTALNRLCLWRWPDVIAGAAKCRLPKSGVTGHAHLEDLVVLANGTLVALAATQTAAWLQQFAPTGAHIGKRRALEHDGFSIRRIARVGDTLVLVGFEEARIETLEGERRAVLATGGRHVFKAVAVSPDFAVVALGGESGVGLWDPVTGQAIDAGAVS